MSVDFSSSFHWVLSLRLFRPLKGGFCEKQGIAFHLPDIRKPALRTEEAPVFLLRLNFLRTRISLRLGSGSCRLQGLIQLLVLRKRIRHLPLMP